MYTIVCNITICLDSWNRQKSLIMRMNADMIRNILSARMIHVVICSFQIGSWLSTCVILKSILLLIINKNIMPLKLISQPPSRLLSNFASYSTLSVFQPHQSLFPLSHESLPAFVALTISVLASPILSFSFGQQSVESLSQRVLQKANLG